MPWNFLISTQHVTIRARAFIQSCCAFYRCSATNAPRFFRKNLSNDFLNNNPQVIEENINLICFYVDQKIVYLIHQELFNYQKINKLKRYEKIIISIFAYISLLTKRLRSTLILNKDIYNCVMTWSLDLVT